MLNSVGCVLESGAGPSAELRDVDHLRDAREPDGLEELERRLAILCREQGPLRAVLARLACALVDLRAWERIGYARLSDYAVERLGLSSRSAQSLAQVGRAFLHRPALEQALVSGRLGWTKVRLLAGLPREEDVERWIARAARLSADQLAKRVRAVDRHSIDEGEDEASPRGGLLELRCSPEVRWKWAVARAAASRAAGRRLGVAEAAELTAAEVLSALPVGEDDEDSGEAGASGGEADAPEADAIEAWAPGSDSAETPAARPARTDSARALRDVAPELRELLDGLDDTDAFGLDARLRRALVREQRLESRIAPLLILAWQPGVHRALGFMTREAWVRERLGMDPTRARALVRLERACAESPPLSHAWRAGALSWVKAGELVPLASADPLGRFVPDWVRWAGRVTVRRLRDDVEQALAVADTDPEAFRHDGGLPPEARRGPAGDEVRGGAGPGREIRANHRDSERAWNRAGVAGLEGNEASEGAEREIGADHKDSEGERDRWLPRSAAGVAGRAHAGLGGKPRADETCWVRLVASPEVVRLFRAALCTVRRRIESDTGRLPTAGEALGAMLDHAFASWGAGQAKKLPARHRVFARDGWRCTAPGCSSMQNLHDHHIRFRSAGGSNAPDNRVTLCAFHHLRGVHGGRLRCAGRAPDGLVWQLGIRTGAPPLLSYHSGDVRVAVAPTF